MFTTNDITQTSSNEEFLSGSDHQVRLQIQLHHMLIIFQQSSGGTSWNIWGCWSGYVHHVNILCWSGWTELSPTNPNLTLHPSEDGGHGWIHESGPHSLTITGKPEKYLIHVLISRHVGTDPVQLVLTAWSPLQHKFTFSLGYFSNMFYICFGFFFFPYIYWWWLWLWCWFDE